MVYLEKFLSIFIHDSIECQCNKHFNMTIQTAPTQAFSEHAMLLTTAFLWIQKDLSILLHTTNLTYMS